jgi:hypothetical protein
MKRRQEEQLAEDEARHRREMEEEARRRREAAEQDEKLGVWEDEDKSGEGEDDALLRLKEYNDDAFMVPMDEEKEIPIITVVDETKKVPLPDERLGSIMIKSGTYVIAIMCYVLFQNINMLFI